MRFTKENPLRVGTDCSGIEAPIMALRQLKVPFSHEFSSETDRHCIASIRANYDPKIIFGDMRQRKLKDIPDIDLYVCGFPCQPFSAAGKRNGVQDPRGTVFWECLRVIRHKKPTIFILENVRGLLSIDRGKTFEAMMAELKKLKMYHVDWKVLNTADYGIPQSRKRVFIVGTQRKCMIKAFEWPTVAPFKNSLEDYVDRNDKSCDSLPSFVNNTRVYEGIMTKNPIFVNLSDPNSLQPNAAKLCPCLTTSVHNFYCVAMNRYMNVKEMLRLQGFPINFKIVVSKTQMHHQLGNTMSVNVLTCLIKSIYCMLE